MGPCEHELIEEAKATVYGVLTARRGMNFKDANTLVSAYLADATDAGHTLVTAWAMLFSAATITADHLVGCVAFHHGEDPTDTLRAFALAQQEQR